MKKIMISQPMRGLTEEQIKKDRDRFLKFAEENNYEVVNTLFTDEWYSENKMKERGVKHIGVCFLAKSIENMANCDIAYFADGWENARGCIIEYSVAKSYGLEIIVQSTCV